MAKSMSEKELHDMASTERKGKPERAAKNSRCRLTGGSMAGAAGFSVGK
jgi:hypothetical protein